MDTGQGETILARPLEEQGLSSVQYLPPEPVPELAGDAKAMTSVLALLALERAQNDLYHHWHRWASDDGLRLLYADIARIETLHGTALQSLLPKLDGLLQALWWECTLIETLGRLGQEETDADVRQGIEYLLPEIVEHAFQVTQIAGSAGLVQAQNVLGSLAGRRGRPMQNHRLATFDLLKRPAGFVGNGAMTAARLQMAIAVVRAAELAYLNLVDASVSSNARRLYAEIASVKEAHLILLESLLDSKRTALERAVASEYGETVWYQRFLRGAEHHSLIGVFRRHLADERGQLAHLREEVRRRVGATAIQPPPEEREPGTLRSVSEYVDGLIESQLLRRSKGRSYIDIGKVKEAFS